VILATVTGDLSHPPSEPSKTLVPIEIIEGTFVPLSFTDSPAPASEAPPATAPSPTTSQPVSPLDAALNLTLSPQKRRLLPRVQDLLAAFRH
jgi:hypothetical protein